MAHWMLPGVGTLCYVVVRADEERLFNGHKRAPLKTIKALWRGWLTSSRDILQDIYRSTSRGDQHKAQPTEKALEETLLRQLTFGQLIAFESTVPLVQPRSVLGQSVSRQTTSTTTNARVAVERIATARDNTRVHTTQHERCPPGTWLDSDREQANDCWRTACLANLLVGNSKAYTRIIERRDFYLWFYKATIDRGYTTRWALAASIVANGAYEVAIMLPPLEDASYTIGVVDNELQGMMREGNQIIFDNVFPKLRQLWLNGPLVSREALDWDMRVLSEEQALVQPLYTGVSPSTMEQLERIARKKGLPGVFAATLSKDKLDTQLPYVQGGIVPGFEGTKITVLHERWLYGMTLGNTFTPGGTGFNSAIHERPEPSSDYKTGVALHQVKTRSHLHQLDAALDGGAAGTPRLKQRVTFLLGQLTTTEQRELLRDQRPDGGQYSHACFRAYVAIPNAYNEFVARITAWRIDLEAQLRFLNGFLKGYGFRAWSLLDYQDIAPMVRAFSQAERRKLHTPDWRKVFLEICDDDTIATAVADLGLPRASQTEWVEEERNWL